MHPIPVTRYLRISSNCGCNLCVSWEFPKFNIHLTLTENRKYVFDAVENIELSLTHLTKSNIVSAVVSGRVFGFPALLLSALPPAPG